MAFEITVEVDYRLNRDEIVGALQKSGATNIHQGTIPSSILFDG